MKLLLTSAGVQNPTIRQALADLLGKPIEESDALCIPTSSYGSTYGSPQGVWRFIAGQSEQPMTQVGWRSVGVLELTALPSIGKNRWVRWVEETDVLLANGGDALYLCHWMRETGMADLLHSYPEKIWAGLSAGSMVMTPRIGHDFIDGPVAEGDDVTLGMVDFSIFPHLDHPALPENTIPVQQVADPDAVACSLENPESCEACQ